MDQKLIEKRAEELKPARELAYGMLSEEPNLSPSPLAKKLQAMGYAVTGDQTGNWVRKFRMRHSKAAKIVCPALPLEFDPIGHIAKFPEQATDIGIIMLAGILKRDALQRARIEELENQDKTHEGRIEAWQVDRKNLFRQYNECQAELKRMTGHFGIDPDTHNLIPKPR